MRLFLILFAFLFSSCGPKETSEPLYKTENYEFKTVTLDVATVIDDIPPIEPIGIRRFIEKIPVIGKAIVLPLDYTSSLLPPLPFNEFVEVGKDQADMWNDPEFLALVKSIRVSRAWVREKTDAEIRAQGMIPGERSYFCRDDAGIEFIKTMNVIFQYSDKRFPQAPAYEIPVAYANNSPKHLDKKNRVMTFGIYKHELRPFVDDYQNFRLRLKATGGLPCVKTYLQAGFEIKIEIQSKK